MSLRAWTCTLPLKLGHRSNDMLSNTFSSNEGAAQRGYWKAICEVRGPFNVSAASSGLVGACRRVAQKNDRIGAYEQASDEWLRATYGRLDDALRRAAIAAAALDLDRRCRALPKSLSSRLLLGHKRLAAALTAGGPYSASAFTRDAAFVAGLAVPSGAMTVFVPPPSSVVSLPLRGRRAAGQVWRSVGQTNLRSGLAWIGQVGVRHWAELHVDDRYVDDFNQEGLIDTYQAAAILLASRPDIAGLRGSSWFFDPSLLQTSPGLAFLRNIAEEGGCRFLRHQTDPEQVAFALQRSPSRRRASEAGAYTPTCVGMYWTRDKLLDWASRRQPVPEGPLAPAA